MLDAGDELDLEIPQTPAISVHIGRGTSFIIFRYVFKSSRPEMCGETNLWCLFVFCSIGEKYLN